MSPILVWDLPTRLLHWALTLTLVGATVLAMAAHGRGLAFQLHMLLGLMALGVVLLRAIWGLTGTRYARFRSFLFGPAALARYLLATVRGRGERHVGHNPGSSYAAYAMLLAPAVLGVSGVLAARGSETAEHLHEPAAHLLVLVVVAHLVGIVWHTIRHRENVARRMIDGRSRGEPDEAIVSSRPLVALLFAVVCLGWGALLWSGFDRSTGAIVLPGGGATLAPGGGEREDQDGERNDREDGEQADRDHDD